MRWVAVDPQPTLMGRGDLETDRVPGHEIEHPMAIVTLGGLITATVLNLFLLPSLYLPFAHGRKVSAQAA